MRAVLFPQGETVSDLFRHAQFPETCRRRNFLCSITFEQDEVLQMLQNEEQCDVPIATFVQGTQGPFHEDSESNSVTDSSTDVPSSDEADDLFSLLSYNDGWSWTNGFSNYTFEAGGPVQSCNGKQEDCFLEQ